jgi:hypothetical protein
METASVRDFESTARQTLPSKGRMRVASMTKRAMPKIRCSFMIDSDLAQQLREVRETTGVSDAEQVRRGIRLWLESRQWPPKSRRLVSV